MSAAPILNPDAIQALRDLSPEGDGEFLRELITIYLTDTPKLMAQLQEGLERKDAVVALRAAHTIKGSSGNFGADEFAAMARQIESAAKSGDLPAAAALMPEFQTRFEKVVVALKALAGP